VRIWADGAVHSCAWRPRPVRFALQALCLILLRTPSHTTGRELASHASLKAVQELLGHESFEVTLRYSHLTPDVKREAVRLLDRRVAPGDIQETEGAQKKNPSADRGVRWSGKRDLNLLRRLMLTARRDTLIPTTILPEVVFDLARGSACEASTGDGGLRRQHELPGAEERPRVQLEEHILGRAPPDLATALPGGMEGEKLA